MPVRRYIPMPVITTTAPQDNFNLFDIFAEDPVASSITIALTVLVLVLFLAFIARRAIVTRRKDTSSRLERLEAQREGEGKSSGHC